MKACLTEALKSTQEDRRLAINLETAKWDLADAEKDLKWLKSAFTSSEKEHEQIQRKTDEARRELEIERWVILIMSCILKSSVFVFQLNFSPYAICVN